MHDYIIVIRQTKWPLGTPVPPSPRRNSWPEFYPRPSYETAQQEADIQGLIRALAFPSNVDWSKFEVCTQNEGKNLKAFVECFIQTFQRHTALNPEAPEHRNLLISTLMGNFLPDINRQIQSSVVGWSSQSLSIIMETATQFLENSLQECRRKRM